VRADGDAGVRVLRGDGSVVTTRLSDVQREAGDTRDHRQSRGVVSALSRLAGACALLVAASVAGQGHPSAAPARVVEQFEVGKGVYVRALTVEPERGAIWVGTSAGVHEVDLSTRGVRQTFTREHGLANEYVFAVGIDGNGHKWFGTNAGGVSRYRNGQWKTFFPMHGLADYWVYSFAEQANGSFWIGTWEGVSKVDPLTGEFTNYVDELVNEWVYGITVDSRDRVWFATEGGVSMYDGGKWTAWTHDDGLGAPNERGLAPSRNTGLGTRSRHDLGVLRAGEPTYNPNYVFGIRASGHPLSRSGTQAEEVIWAGTWGGGLSRFDGERWQNWSTRDGLAGNIVYSIAETADGVLWVGTNAGVSRFDGREWQTLDRRAGLFDDHVYAVAAAPDGTVWAGTRGGVVRIGAP
jgi:ligand-binding sensor domain-containing protein